MSTQTAADVRAEMHELFDVVAVKIATGKRRLLAERKTEADAEAIVKMAVFRRGVEVEFYTTEPHPARAAQAEERTP